LKNPGPSLFGSSGLVALRLAIGIGLMCHGYATLFGSEAGTAPLAGMLKEKLGMPQPELMAAVAKWTELVGGAMLALGLLSRLAALVVTINMIVAVYVHAVVNSDPFFRGHGSEGGSWELAALYLAGAFCILTCGAGKLSVDEIVFGDDEETPPGPANAR